MATVTIVELGTVTNLAFGIAHQHAEIEVAEGGNTYAWNVGGIPSNLDAAGVQSYLDARAAQYYAAASAEGRAADVFSNYERIGLKLIIALALVVLDEINAIRALERSLHPAQAGQAALQDRTLVQLKSAVKNKLQNL